MKIVSGFEVTGWDAMPYGEEGDRPLLSEAHVVKRYHGDLDGEGRARLLMCRASADGPLENAGMWRRNRCRARSGTARAHSCSSTGESPEPGSRRAPAAMWCRAPGTGELGGLSGTMEIHVDADGRHTLALDYEIE